MKFSHLNIGTRIYLCFGLVLALLAALLLVSAYTLEQLDQANTLNQRTFKRIDTLGDLRANLLELQSGQRAYALTGAEAAAARVQQAKQNLARGGAALQALAAGFPQKLQRLQQARELIDNYIEKVIDPALRLRDAVNRGEATHEELRAFFEDGPGRANIRGVITLFDEMGDADDQLLAERVALVRALRERCLAIMVYGGLFTLMAAALCAHVLMKNITRPLHEAVRVARNVANGDLTSRIAAHGRDETGMLLSSLEAMNHNLSRMVREVRNSAETIAMAAGEIATGNLDLSSRTETQAAALEQSVASLGQLTHTVSQNAEHAQHARDLARAASQVAASGGAEVVQVVQTMDAINGASSRIVAIIDVIDGIAFQTNILALNAAVEAARAGEQGSGFAVVAAEVRSLARRAAAAAREIKQLIDDSVARVEEGSKLVGQAGLTIQEVVSSVDKVSAIVAEISAAGREQDSGIRQVNLAIAHIDENTQQNAALVEQGAAASESLKDQALRLTGAVAAFRIDVQEGTPTNVTTRQLLPAPKH